MIKRTRVVREYPINRLQDVLIVPMSIYKNNAGLPIDRKLLAESLGTTHKSSGFITKINSSFSYGLTMGGYKDELISLTELGKSIVAPKNKDEYENSLIKSALNPQVFKKLYNVLAGKILPSDSHMVNLLEREFSMPSQISRECLEVLKSNGIFSELIKETSGGYVVVDREVSSLDINEGKIIDGRLHRDFRDDSVPNQILLISNATKSDSLKLIYDLLETIDIKYTELSLLNFQDIAGENNIIDKDYYLKTNQCSSAIIYFKKIENNDCLDILEANLMLNLGALFYSYDMKVVIVIENSLKLIDLLKGFDPLVLNESDDNDINKLLLNKMINKGIIKITA